jgi:hypothetical protein
MNDNKNKNTTIIMPPYSNNSSDWTSTSSSTTSSSSRGTSKPKSALHLTSPSSSKNTQQQHQQNDLLQLAAQELETMKQPKQHQQLSQKIPTQEQSFPPACLRLMSSLPGNLTCIDCHSRTDISWASVSFGCLMCLQCSGKHRSLGVQTSFVKSVSMDGWKVHEVLSMLEGGNEQLDQFFERHEMGNKSSSSSSPGNNNHVPTSPTARSGTLVVDRYKTKAASFYRQHLINHAKELGEGGIYKGREASRSKKKKSSSPSSSSSRKHHRDPQQHPQLLPTVTESSASTAETETTTSSNNNRKDNDALLLPPPLSPSQQQPLKRHRSKGSGSGVSMEMSDLDLDRME